ncbi:hypothetical protein JTF12_09565 [Leclercia adecarboxylata]|uniref:hypothetical protein n=1 Tax=Leclercia adecarboxylata TaxID=83655 RepID=UPI0019525493|nr:hypothetical protein [Leclercia adecarboxylata]MBM6634581.1 hypothetical protein [Leclercia adecarboxylata]
MTFTKEQLIDFAADRIGRIPYNAPDGELAKRALYEIALAALRAQPTPAPELKMAELINKFYERYPLETFKSDTERSAALGCFMAGAELQCFGEFIKYEDLCRDE